MSNKKIKNKVSPVSPFWNNQTEFVKHIEGLNKSLVSMILISGLLQREEDKLNSFIKKKGKGVRTEKNLTYYSISQKDKEVHSNLRRQRDNSRIAYKILPRSIFVGLVSQFDIYIASLIKIILNIQSNIISPEKTLSFKDIKNFKTIKDAVNHLIEKEIDILLFDSHSAHLEWIGTKTGIDIKKYFSKEMSTFIELTERRNLFVHSDGIVNEHYLSKCRQAGVTLDPNIKKGTLLPVNPKYFEQSCACLYKISFKLTYLLWKKFVPKDAEKVDILFNNEIVIDLILQKKYLLAEELLEFIETVFGSSTDQMKRLFVINLALAKKLNGKMSEVTSVIKKMDWTSCHDDFKLAVAVLNDNFETSYELMKKIGKKGELVDEEIYRTMPIFNSLRKQKKFAEVFKKIYRKKFSLPQEKHEIKFSIEEKKHKKTK